MARVSCTPRVYIFVQRTDACPILVRMPRETCGDVNISVIDTFRPTVEHRVPRARKIAQASSVYLYTVIRRPIGMRACNVRRETHRAYTRSRACVRICVMWARCLSRGQNDQLSPRVSFYLCPFAPRLLGVTSPPLSPGSTHRSPACV